MRLNRLRWTLSIAASLALPLHAQTTPPDAGQTTQERQAPVAEPVPGTTVETPAAPTASPPPGGQTLPVTSLVFEGNTVFSSDELLAVAALPTGAVDMAQVVEAANRVTAHYREHGYPFARALPAQKAYSRGELKLTVVEGRYGAVTATADNAARSAQAQAIVAPLKTGDVITQAPLERATLLLSDLPGYVLVPVMKPGADVGTGDLDLGLSRSRPFDASLKIDNHGSRYTGYNQLRGAAAWNSPFVLGDRVSAGWLYTSEDLNLGALSYERPLDANGLRGSLGYNRTTYQLGREFAGLAASGTADIVTASASKPLRRARDSNLSVNAAYNRKWLKDEQGAVATSTSKDSDSVTVGAYFDRFAPGVLTYGTASWTQGWLRNDDPTAEGGYFSRLNADVTQLRTLTETLTTSVRLAAQIAQESLDSSEGASLGGIYGVRAYPTGEGTGDSDLLLQSELRYRAGDFTPYVFFDAGLVKGDAASGSTDTLSGGGLGTRWQHTGFNADVLVAIRADSPPDTESRDPKPRLWMSLGYSFF